MNSKQVNNKEVEFNDFFSNIDIVNMSTDNIDDIFGLVYKFIKFENSAVYPHLNGI